VWLQVPLHAQHMSGAPFWTALSHPGERHLSVHDDAAAALGVLREVGHEHGRVDAGWVLGKVGIRLRRGPGDGCQFGAGGSVEAVSDGEIPDVLDGLAEFVVDGRYSIHKSGDGETYGSSHVRFLSFQQYLQVPRVHE
jgi:hypothetical protein